MKFGKAIPSVITITPTANDGFDVRVGCFFHGSFSDKATLMEALADYLNDPKGKAFNPEGGITLNLKGNVAPLGTTSPGTPLNVT